MPGADPSENLVLLGVSEPQALDTANHRFFGIELAHVVELDPARRPYLSRRDEAPRPSTKGVTHVKMRVRPFPRRWRDEMDVDVEDAGTQGL